MKSTLILIVLFFISSFSFAQEITGALRDSSNNSIPYATVLLFKAQDSSLKVTALSDSLGYFKVKVSADEKYYLQIQSIGFASYTSEIFTGGKNFSRIILSPQISMMNTVSVVVQKPFIERTARGFTLNVAESPVLKGANSKDILEKIPGAILNQDGSVSIKGKQNVLIYIDGKPTNLSLDDLVRLLESTPASEIERVEVYETPPAKFDASGNAGIVNFVTKKGRTMGFNGSVGSSIGYGNFHKFSPWASANYRNKKINVFGNAWYFNNQYDHFATMDMRMIDNNQQSSFFNNFHRIHHPVGFGVRAGCDYFINDKTTVGYLVNVYDGNLIGYEPSSVDVSGPAKSVYDRISAIQNFNYYWSGQSHNINLKRELNKGSLNFDIDYARRQNGNQSSNLNEYYLGTSALTPFYALQRGAANNDIVSSKVDFEKTIFKDVAFSAGAKAGYVKSTNDFKAFKGTNESDIVENLQASNTFEYQESIYAAYTTFAKKWKKNWSADAGLRVEHTEAVGVSPTTAISFNKSYTNFFPNVGATYKVDNKYSWSSSFTRRIDRPNYYQLNPFQTQTNQFNIHQGNPQLNPQITSVINLTYGLKDKYYFTLSASTTKGLMNEVIKQDEQLQVQIHTTENLDFFNNYSFNAAIPVKIKKWWTTNWNGTLFYNQMTSNLDWGVVGYNLLSFSINMQQNFSLPKNYKVELSGYYNYNSYWNIWFVEPYYQVDVACNKNYKNFNFNLSVKDFLNVREGNGGIFQGNINMPTTYKPESRKVMLSVTYRFGNDKVKGERKRATGSEDLQKRAGE